MHPIIFRHLNASDEAEEWYFYRLAELAYHRFALDWEKSAPFNFWRMPYLLDLEGMSYQQKVHFAAQQLLDPAIPPNFNDFSQSYHFYLVEDRLDWERIRLGRPLRLDCYHARMQALFFANCEDEEDELIVHFD